MCGGTLKLDCMRTTKGFSMACRMFFSFNVCSTCFSFITCYHHHLITKLLSPYHHLITTSSPPHHHLITASSPPHHHLITTSSPPHSHPIISPAPPHHHAIIFPFPPHHSSQLFCRCCKHQWNTSTTSSFTSTKPIMKQLLHHKNSAYDYGNLCSLLRNIH